MRYGKLLLAAAAASFTLFASLVPTTAMESKQPPDGAPSANLASTMVQYGMANHDPATLLAAAHIINSLKANVGKPTQTEGAGKPESYDPMALLKLAKSYATGTNASLASAIDGEMKNVSSTQSVCYYQYYYYYGYYYYRYVCY